MSKLVGLLIMITLFCTGGYVYAAPVPQGIVNARSVIRKNLTSQVSKPYVCKNAQAFAGTKLEFVPALDRNITFRSAVIPKGYHPKKFMDEYKPGEDGHELATAKEYLAALTYMNRKNIPNIGRMCAGYRILLPSKDDLKIVVSKDELHHLREIESDAYTLAAMYESVALLEQQVQKMKNDLPSQLEKVRQDVRAENEREREELATLRSENVILKIQKGQLSETTKSQRSLLYWSLVVIIVFFVFILYLLWKQNMRMKSIMTSSL